MKISAILPFADVGDWIQSLRATDRLVSWPVLGVAMWSAELLRMMMTIELTDIFALIFVVAASCSLIRAISSWQEGGAWPVDSRCHVDRSESAGPPGSALG